MKKILRSKSVGNSPFKSSTPQKLFTTGLTVPKVSPEKQQDDEQEFNVYDTIHIDQENTTPQLQYNKRGKNLLKLADRSVASTPTKTPTKATAKTSTTSTPSKTPCKESPARKSARLAALKTPTIERAQKKRKADKKLKTVVQDSESSGIDEEEERDNEIFFKQKVSKKATSDNTLSQLTLLEPKEFVEALKKYKPSHLQHRSNLQGLFQTHFVQWAFELSGGFNLMFYGYGSKKSLLEEFAATLTDAPVLMMNGFYPTLTIKDITSKILDSLGQDTVGLPQDHLATLSEMDFKLYLVIHNIDGPNLRTDKAQAVLAGLANLEQIQMVASIDHIHGPLLWDNAKLSSFNWSWHDLTTFEPYLIETTFENSFMLRKDLGPRGVLYVLKSLTQNARKVYLILANQQLNEEESDQKGLLYTQFYRLAHQDFLVSNEMAFKTQLTEFKDHQMVTSKRTGDGEWLSIPLPDKVIREIVSAMSE